MWFLLTRAVPVHVVREQRETTMQHCTTIGRKKRNDGVLGHFFAL